MRWSILLSVIVGVAAAAFMVTTEAPIEDPTWWYTNDTPPTLLIQAPSGPLRGQAEAIVMVEPATRANIVSTHLDGRPIQFTGTRLQIDSATLPDGPHRVEIVARDTSRRANESLAAWEFHSDNTGPHVEPVLNPAEGPTEGRTITIRLRLEEAPSEIAGELEGRPLRFSTEPGNEYWAVVGIPPEPAYRNLRLMIRATDVLGNATVREQSLPLIRTRFPVEDLDFDPAIDNLANPQVRAQEDARLMPIYRDERDPKRWDGLFLRPVEGPITTDFGTRRSYNGRFPDGNHAGMDFGAPLGAPVKAAASGVVAFADSVPVRGNVLILNHGVGVYTTYAHLQAFAARVGESVVAGDVIGRVGSSGLSTGPHLHWELWVASANVDPLTWTVEKFP